MLQEVVKSSQISACGAVGIGQSMTYSVDTIGLSIFALILYDITSLNENIERDLKGRQVIDHLCSYG